jgi:hypothetical protein
MKEESKPAGRAKWEGGAGSGLPAKEWLDQKGGRQFSRIIEFDSPAHTARFQTQVLAALDDYLAHNPGAGEERR